MDGIDLDGLWWTLLFIGIGLVIASLIGYELPLYQTGVALIIVGVQIKIHMKEKKPDG